MIHHISIAAQNPEHVAAVLAEVLGGVSFAFPPARGGYIALCDDGHATAIEVYLAQTLMQPGEADEEVRFVDEGQAQGYSPTHAAISVARDEAAIHAIAQREGWRAVTCERGGLFKVVEFWVENRQLIEFLTPEMARDYLATITPQKWAGYLEAGLS
ncbi:hypothetical protein [Methylococcus sp. EFPC2]|uniref:hypothetical protein n=1 Tax=Methylococcus sp. EFPC2 TaxID=2812648 RepID=UPI0019676400|nr:hypothetical protein [Methylococcus sp. EFPC2]QSA96896.1 hypothetical protein JWZ97_17090 [Methylococcus sp. EFPC2]